VSLLRDIIVISSEKSPPATLFDRIGKIKGLTDIVNVAFQYITENKTLCKFYKGKNIDVIKNKYIYFLAGEMGGEYTWTGKDISACHDTSN